MCRRSLSFFATLGLSVVSVSCPWNEGAVATPAPSPERALAGQAATAALAPTSSGTVRPPPALPAPAALTASAWVAPSTTAAAIDPALLSVLPPELVDDGSDVMVDTDPVAPPPHEAHEVPELASIAKETWVFAEPHWKARRLGSLRAGAIVERRAQPVVKNHACPEGWYRIEPRGYVCVGQTATLDRFHPVVEASSKRPRHDGLPYTYVMARSPAPPLYARIPSMDEALHVEPDLKVHLRSGSHDAGDLASLPVEAIPNVLLYGRSAPALGGDKPRRETLWLGQAKPRAGFALLSTFQSEDGRHYGLTTDLAVLPLDRTRVVKPSSFHGIALDDDVTLPIAFVKTRHATRWMVGPRGSITHGNALTYREAVPLTGAERRIGDTAYLVAKDGSLVVTDQVVRVDRFQHAPAWATGKRRWVDVSILRQALVAYEGKKPVYTTLVSTGADGLGDPNTTHSTILGAFLIHTKHVSVNMDDDQEGHAFDFRDVPFVQYFTEGFALHAAYWHDDFGVPRSHGCVNLAPVDAAWLFNWTTPEVPKGWHAALSRRQGSLVYTHP